MSQSTNNESRGVLSLLFTSKRLAQGLAITLAVTSVMVGSAGVAVPDVALDNDATVLKCVLACDPASRLCSRYAKADVPEGYVRVKYMPPRYKSVRSKSRCGAAVCSTARGVGCLPPP